MNIEQLKAQLQAVQEANAIKLQEAVTISMLKAQIALESNPTLQDAKARLAFSAEQTSKLETLVKECEMLIAGTPMYNQKTRDNRKWSGTHRYTFGTQIDLLYQLCSGIMYSCQEHRQLLLAHTGLNSELVEQTLTAFGQPSYYSRNHNTVVEEKPYSVAAVKDVLNVLQSTLGVVVNTDTVTETAFETEFLRAENKAHEDDAAAQEAILSANLVI